MTTFIVGQFYNCSQNISRLALTKGHTPLFYSGLKYLGFEKVNGVIEHQFEYEGESKFFDDENINTGKSEDNSLVFSNDNFN